MKKLRKHLNLKYVKIIAAIKVTLLMGYLAMNGQQIHDDYVFESTSKSVVRLLNPLNHGSGGTGFAVRTPAGEEFTLTNSHVCEIANRIGYIDAQFPNQDRYIRLTVLEKAPFTDLCLLDPVPGLSPLKIASDVSLNETVTVVGFPFLMPISPSKGKLISRQIVSVLYAINVTKEECSGETFQFVDTSSDIFMAFMGIKSLCFRHIDSYYSNIITYPGNSGSPVVNYWGNVVGVLFAGDNRTNHGFIIPIDQIKKFLKVY